ncbi:hypothetical protein CEXT_369481 [Caerostris extrusa]|uniref:Uncharacterized protein n=1 Tax=Caerostris extrusa TaxID=172846 RepID=A0AAV4U6W8_CAEEX|nr:hypothetical protein CEXT_369481 [Caerostris extrusa]
MKREGYSTYDNCTNAICAFLLEEIPIEWPLSELCKSPFCKRLIDSPSRCVIVTGTDGRRNIDRTIVTVRSAVTGKSVSQIVFVQLFTMLSLTIQPGMYSVGIYLVYTLSLF